MDEELRIFNNGFNKILDLIELGENEISEKFAKFVKLLPENIKEAISECEDFETHNEDFAVDYMRLVNAVSLDFIKKKPYLRFEIYVHKLFEDDLSPKKLFSLTVRNTNIKKPNLKLFYKEEAGKLNFIGTNDTEGKQNLEFSWEVNLDYDDFGPYLEYFKYFRGVEIYSRKTHLTFDELTQYFETDEKYEDDWEIEFDADFEI